MAFRRTYNEILELIRQTALESSVARAILRKSGIRSGDDNVASLPPGGKKGDLLYLYQLSPYFGLPLKDFRWTPPTALYNDLNDESIPENMDFPSDRDFTISPAQTYGFGPRPVIRFGGLRNPPSVPSYYSTDFFMYNAAARGMRPIGDHQRKQFFEWESIPQGEWYFPLNVNWFVKKVDLGASARFNNPVQISVCAMVVEGNPSADLKVCYSTSSRTGPWTELASVDLQPGGLRQGEWITLPEEAKGDVWLTLRLNARSPVSLLHTAYAESRVRWDYPSDVWQPYYPWLS